MGGLPACGKSPASGTTANGKRCVVPGCDTATEELLRTRNAEQEHLVQELRAELNVKAVKLEEVNLALKTLLRTAEDFKEDMEARILSNISQVILPSLEKLKRSRLNGDRETCFTILESQIRNITSGFVRKLSPPHLNLTPREIRIAAMIKEQRTTKEIAGVLDVSESAVIFHRHNIRKKLGVVSKKVNLGSYLQSYL